MGLDEFQFRVGDIVRLDKFAPLDFSKEEAKLDKDYKVTKVAYSTSLKSNFVQLEGIKSSYKFSWILPVKVER